MRSLLEKYTHQFILRRRLPTQFGNRPLYVSSEGGLRYLKPTLDNADPVIYQVVSQFIKPGYTVWDIGANVGLFSFSSAHQVGHTGGVLAVEPDIWLNNLLRKSALANPDVHVDVLPVALSNQIGVSRFNIAVRARSTNFLAEVVGSTQTGGIRHTVLVPTMTLDFLLTQYNRPDFVKIDVETAELLVLTGGERLLTETRPAIFCEVSSENAKAVGNLFRQHNYQLFSMETGSPVSTDKPDDSTLALPTEHWFLT